MSYVKPSLPMHRELPMQRRAEVIDAALRVAARVGSQGLIRDLIAKEAGLSSSLLHRYYGSMDLLRETVILAAFERKNVEVLYKSLSIENFKKMNKCPELTEAICTYLRS